MIKFISFYYPLMRTRVMNKITLGGNTMENQMSLIVNKISNELEWSSYVDDWQKTKMVEEVLTKFSLLMEEAIKIASEK